MLSVASIYLEQISKGDSKSAFQHTPSTRAKPDVLRILKVVSGAVIDQFYYITIHFQGLSEAIRAWFNYTCGSDGFLQKPPCNLILNISDSCVLLWRGPPTFDPKETGKVTIGISTDDNLECISQNKANRDHLLIIRQANVDRGIEYIIINLLDQIIGIAITYTPTSTTLIQPTQISDLQNLFNPNDVLVHLYHQLGVKKQEIFYPCFYRPSSISSGYTTLLGRTRFDNTISRIHLLLPNTSS